MAKRDLRMIVLNTYRDPDQPKPCCECNHSKDHDDGSWTCLVIDETICSFGTCDAWEEINEDD